MKRFFSLALCLSLIAFTAGMALAAEGNGTVARDYSGYNLAIGGQNLIQSSTGTAGFSKAGTDTFYIYGGPGTAEGKFQQFETPPGGACDWQGWTGHDMTEVAPHWRSTNNQALAAAGPGQFTGNAGTNQCVASNHPGTDYVGYGNNWNDWLVFKYDVTALGIDPATQSTDVQYSCELKYHTEPGYDYTHFYVVKAGTDVEITNYTGNSLDSLGVYSAVSFNSVNFGTITYAPGDYDGNDIVLKIATTSDGGWSDEDGLNPTGGLGAAAVDNIEVKAGVSGGAQVQVSFADWESTDGNPHDNAEGDVSNTNNGAGSGTTGWTPTPASFFGEFSKMFNQFQDIDVCRDNITCIATFINDGTPPNNAPLSTITPATSPTWSYGVPGGYVVEYNGGLNGTQINDEIWSPEFNWDLAGTADDVANGGAVLGFTAWLHLNASNALFYMWHVRSYTAANGWTGWADRNFVYYSGGSALWSNVQQNVTDLLLQNPEKVQIALAVVDMSAIWGLPGLDATPSPCFDNVYFKKYKIGGPVLSTRTIDLASDGFPVDGSKTGSVRFDSNIDRNPDTLVPGDSITCDIVTVIPGTTLDFASVKLQAAQLVNPDFAAARALGLATVGAVLAGTDPTTGWDIYTYAVNGDSTVTSTGGVVVDRYNFDLPDGKSNGIAHIADEDSLFFPGDVLHYYLEASDDAGNTSTLPSDITGFMNFAPASVVALPDTLIQTQYSRVFTVRALPTIVDDGNGGTTQPHVLFWNDFGHRGGENMYLQAFAQNGMIEGKDYDTYTTKGPSSGVGNGLGSAGFHGANAGQLDGYDCMIYVCGDLNAFTINDGTGANVGSGTNDFSNDVGTLTDWFNQASSDSTPNITRHAAFFGDNLGTSMQVGGTTDLGFMTGVMGVSLVASDIGPKIQSQTTPQAVSTGADPSFVSSYVVDGGCLAINTFDELQGAQPGTAMTHEFLDTNGAPYSTSQPAGFEWYRAEPASSDTTVVTQYSNVFPYGFVFVRGNLNAPGGTGLSAQSLLLKDIFASWGCTTGGGQAIGTGDLPKKLVVSQNYPNPFNPNTTIKYALPVKGQVSIKVYNVRGALVTTLVDGVMDAGEHSVIWSGKDAHGAAVSTGVYLYKVHTAGTDVVKKMALIK